MSFSSTTAKKFFGFVFLAFAFSLSWYLVVLLFANFGCFAFALHYFLGAPRPRMQEPPLSQRQTSNGMTKPMLYHKTHTAWQKTYCMSFAMPSYFPWIHGKTHVISARPYPWLFPCLNLSLVSQLFAFDSTF